MTTRRGPQAPYVATVEELRELVSEVKSSGAFSFDVETRGNIHRHADVLSLIEEEWQQKLLSLKSDHPSVLQRSRQAIEDYWTKQLALDTLRNEVFWIGIATSGGRSWAIPMGHPNGEVIVSEMRGDGSTIPPAGYRSVTKGGKESMARAKFFIPAEFTAPPVQLTQEQVFTELESIFMDPSIVKVNQNIKFDAKSVAKYYNGRLPEGMYVDTLNLMHIVNENLREYDLSSLIDEVFGWNPYYRHGKIGGTIEWEPFSKACNYVHYDCRWAWLLFTRLWRKIAAVPSLYNALQIDLPVIRIVAQMELNGIHVNKRELVKLGKELDIKANSILRDMSFYTPVDFNPDSSLSKSKFLFGKKSEGGLGLRVTKKTDSGSPSTDAEALGKLKGEHPVVDMLLEYAEVKKIKSTFVDGMYPLLHTVGSGKYLGKVHPQFHFHRTVTGRFSSSNPNLQNQPRDSRVRSLFVASPHDSLVVADYSQIEMRIMAMFSQDPELLRIFENGIDVHTGTATVILGREPVDSEERNIYGKVPNFLMGYGGQAKRLVAATNGKIDLKRAQFIVDGYNNGYAGLTTWKNKVIRDCKRHGYVETLGGRRRRLPEINADRNQKDGWAAATSAERQAINAVVQGTAAEICKKAMVKLWETLDWPKCQMLVQVHDEMVMSVPTEELGLWVPKIEAAMGNDTVIWDGKVDHGVKLEVEAHAAGSWYDAKGG